MPPAWSDAVRHVKGKVEVQWNGTDWIDESANLISANGDQSLQSVWQSPGSFSPQGPWKASFQFRNASDRSSATNSLSGIYASISTNKGFGVPIRFSMGLWNGSSFDYARIFTGYVDDISVTSTRDNRATFSWFHNAPPLLPRK